MFATGAGRPKHHPLDGSGSLMRKSGTDFMMVDGTTGAHPRQDSPPLDGPGMLGTGIMVAMSSSGRAINGTDSKVKNGYITEVEFQSNQVSHMAQESAGHSISSRRADSRYLCV